MRKLYLTLLILSALIFSGCTTHLADLTVISNRNVTLNKIDIAKCPKKDNIKGTDSTFIFLFFPLGNNNIRAAVDDALEKGQGDLVVDASIYERTWWLILFGMTSINVEGTVVNTKAAVE